MNWLELACSTGMKNKVRQIAVNNFLGSLDGLTVQEALGNLELDAASYRWNAKTRAAIHKGIMAHFFPGKRT